MPCLSNLSKAHRAPPPPLLHRLRQRPITNPVTHLQLPSKTHFSRFTCKLETKDGSGSGKAHLKDKNGSKKKVVFLGVAPSLSDSKGSGGGDGGEGKSGGSPPLLASFNFKRIPKRLLAFLSNLPLAIGEMFSIAALMALGTVIDQGEAPDYYFQKYPEENPVMGFVTWRWILTLGFDHMFSSPVFLGLLVLLAASLMACTYTTQIPLVKVARRWSFMQSAKSIRKQEFSDSLPQASLQDLGVLLMGAGYEMFEDNKQTTIDI